jgi:hypothetical protein
MKNIARKLRRSLLLSALMLGLSAPVFAQDAPPGQQISPDARALIDRMGAYLKGLQAFSIEAHGTRDEVLDHGFKLQHNETAWLKVQRPNKMRAEVSGDLKNREFVYDGKTITIDNVDDNAYATAPATDDLGKLIGDILDSGAELPLIDVLYQATAGTLTENVRTGLVVGDTEVEGVPCTHLVFRQADTDWQLWVEKGERPVPRKIVITTLHEVGDPQYSATLTWNTQPKFDKDAFTYVPDKDAQKVAFAQPGAFVAGDK